jgi:hypothetical protein
METLKSTATEMLQAVTTNIKPKKNAKGNRAKGNPAVVNDNSAIPDMEALKSTAIARLQAVYVVATQNMTLRKHEIKSNKLNSTIKQHVEAIESGEVLETIINNVQSIQELLGPENAVSFFHLYEKKKQNKDILFNIGCSDCMSLCENLFDSILSGSD